MIAVLRLHHRYIRDSRISTHIALVARAFGADILYIERDEKIKKTLDNVCDKFGGNFEVIFFDRWQNVVSEWNGKIVHLTMYGEHINKFDFEKIRKDNLLIVIGGKKVPPEVYKISDFNIAVGNQPHSEVAALAVFLDRFFENRSIEKTFDGRLKIIPSKKGKRVVTS